VTAAPDGPAPDLIDLQVNGAAGHDLVRVEVPRWPDIVARLLG